MLKLSNFKCLLCMDQSVSIDQSLNVKKCISLLYRCIRRVEGAKNEQSMKSFVSLPTSP